MAEDDWKRSHWEPGGADAFVAFWVIGELAGELTITPQHRVTLEIPEGVEVHRLERGTEAGDSFFHAFTNPNGLVMGAALALRPELAKAVHASSSVYRILGDVEDPADLVYLRSIIGVVQAMLETGGVAVVDTAFHWWSAQQWHDDVFARDAPSFSKHVSIFTSEEDVPGNAWLHTRGMRLFGRPDLSVRGVDASSRAAVTAMIVRLIELQAMGGLVPDGQPVKMAGIPAGWTCKHAGDVDDPEFNNVHIAIGPH